MVIKQKDKIIVLGEKNHLKIEVLVKVIVILEMGGVDEDVAT
jgi:hypothetical protein